MSSFSLPQIVFKHICTYIFYETKDDILKTPLSLYVLIRYLKNISFCSCVSQKKNLCLECHKGLLMTEFSYLANLLLLLITSMADG